MLKELIENYKYIIFERNDSTHKDIELEQYIKNNEILNNNKNNFHILNLKEFNEINSGIIRNYIKQNKVQELITNENNNNLWQL